MMLANDIKIDAELASLLRALTTEESDALEANLVAAGKATEPLVVWAQTSALLDGHNRLRLCTKHRLPYQIHSVSLPDFAAAKAWIVTHQLGRRNLTPEEREYYIGAEYLAKRKAPIRPIGKGDQNDHLIANGKTAEKIAKSHGVSGGTVRRAAKQAQALDAVAEVDPDLRPAALAGEVTRAEVREIAAAPADERAEVAARIMDTVKTAREHGRKRKPEPKPEPQSHAEAHSKTWATVKRALSMLHSAMRESGMIGFQDGSLDAARVEEVMRGAIEAGAETDIAVATAHCKQLAIAVGAIGRAGVALGREKK